MKIIQEIEKGRLSENEMNSVTGGLNVVGPEQCVETKYSKCYSKFRIEECALLLTCGSYLECSQRGYMNTPCVYGECSGFKSGQGLLQLA